MFYLLFFFDLEDGRDRDRRLKKEKCRGVPKRRRGRVSRGGERWREVMTCVQT